MNHRSVRLEADEESTEDVGEHAAFAEVLTEEQPLEATAVAAEVADDPRAVKSRRDPGRRLSVISVRIFSDHSGA